MSNGLIFSTSWASNVLNIPCKVYPTLAGGIPVADDTGSWTITGNSTQIIPLAYTTKKIFIKSIVVENVAPTAKETYEIILYYNTGGAAVDVECGRCRFALDGVTDVYNSIGIKSSVIPKGAKVCAKLATSAGGSTVTLSLQYIEIG